MFHFFIIATSKESFCILDDGNRGGEDRVGELEGEVGMGVGVLFYHLLGFSSWLVKSGLLLVLGM